MSQKHHSRITSLEGEVYFLNMNDFESLGRCKLGKDRERKLGRSFESRNGKSALKLYKIWKWFLRADDFIILVAIPMNKLYSSKKNKSDH